jgi:hypothetical protein
MNTEIEQFLRKRKVDEVLEQYLDLYRAIDRYIERLEDTRSRPTLLDNTTLDFVDAYDPSLSLSIVVEGKDILLGLRLYYEQEILKLIEP